MFKKTKYEMPSVGVLPLSLEGALMVGSVVNFEAGTFTSVGQKVDNVDFSTDESSPDWGGLEWEYE